MENELLKLAEETFGKPFEYYTGYEIPQLNVTIDFEDDFQAIEMEMRIRMLMEVTGKSRDDLVWDAMKRGMEKAYAELEVTKAQAGCSNG